MEMLSRGEAEQRIRERAEADPAFRAELLDEPKESARGLSSGCRFPRVFPCTSTKSRCPKCTSSCRHRRRTSPTPTSSWSRAARAGTRVPVDDSDGGYRRSSPCTPTSTIRSPKRSLPCAAEFRSRYSTVPANSALEEVARTLPSVLARRPVGLELRLAGEARAQT